MEAEMLANRYDDIIDLPHWQSPTRSRMSRLNRAAQFAPFAALIWLGCRPFASPRILQATSMRSRQRNSVFRIFSIRAGIRTALTTVFRSISPILILVPKRIPRVEPTVPAVQSVSSPQLVAIITEFLKSFLP